MSQPDVATEEHRSNLDRLNSLRNHWTQFGEDSSSVAIDYARTAVHAGIELVTKLPLPPTNSLYANFTDETRLKVTIDSLLQLLAAAERDDHTESAAACDDSDSAQYAAFADETGKLDDI